MDVRIRPAAIGDLPALIDLRATLWPDCPRDQHEVEVRAVLAGAPHSTMPLAILVADAGGELAGFVEVGLRSHADGCDPRRPVGFVEGWLVAKAHRRRGLGRALIDAAEEWCRDRGCRELASDTWLADERSIAAHRALGFEVVDRCVNFRKALTTD